MDYRETLNLPKTAFPMKANLPVREPEWLALWEKIDLYAARRKASRGLTPFVLHDGPPYANGDIHTGTALNKILKDMINRYWSLAGRDVIFQPGWDTHGLPIEMRALKALGVSQHQIDPLTLRQECAKVAHHYIGVMTEEFRRLGVLADWAHPYVTLSPGYEGAELRVFAEMVERGLIYRDLKPVYWCPHCETALAEGEIEYRPHESDAIYVLFRIEEPHGLAMPSGTQAVIWTTTPWTIPANVALALHPAISYVVVDTERGPLLMAEALVDAVLARAGLTRGETRGRWLGRELEGVVAVHPYLGHRVPLVLGDHVTQDSGTGLVHTAPGHGVEDFEVGQRYRLDVVQPLDDRGYFLPETPLVGGLFYAEANAVIKARLADAGALLWAHEYQHQYAYCWRCKNPVIYRATRQWFLSIDRIRQDLLKASDQVRWDPEWGQERMRGMVKDRADWCLSRQRVWGVPIPAFYCDACGTSILEAELVRRVAAIVEQEGSDSWWTRPARDFLPDGYRCPHCGGTSFQQERDVFDVWLDSGSSQAAVLRPENGHPWPCDLVLEGNDQYRGWFQSLLTTGVATRSRAPYRMVLTHGMVLDQLGREMHKSLGNTVDPMDLVKEFGSDILRLWVAASEFRGDVRISEEILRQLAESYRKIRNTFRFLLGNLYDFDPDGDVVARIDDPLNRWALYRVNGWLDEAQTAYERYTFHLVVHGLVRLVTIDLSSFYLDVVKDRLYTLGPNDPRRRETQSVLYYILTALTRAVAPILAFTAEEVYQAAPRHSGDPPSIHLTRWPERWDVRWTVEDSERMARLMRYRDAILKALEAARSAKSLGNSLMADVTLGLPPEEAPLSQEDLALLVEMAMVARIDVVPAPALEARALPTSYAKCERCWRHTPDVEAGLCARCRQVLMEYAR
ncbi:MAG: isoleucine--tRNA ligase [Firmicutes bacterium]|nr:isoleucine--tRNA ligase [Bacillota bacterium]